MASESLHQHRSTYNTLPTGRDRQIVQRLGDWLVPTVSRVVTESGPRARVLDVGCGRQPLRAVVESAGGLYVGFDVAQNPEGTVDIVGRIDEPVPNRLSERIRAYDVVICTEVLEHVVGWERAWSNLRALAVDDGYLIVTVPFIVICCGAPSFLIRTCIYGMPRC